MEIEIQKTTLDRILPLRALYLQDTNFQIRYNALHERGLTDSYAVLLDGKMIGYGSVMGQESKDRDTLFEYFLIPTYRDSQSEVFRELLDLSGVSHIWCQSNDHHLSPMLFEFGKNICCLTVLFEDHHESKLSAQDVIFRDIQEGEDVDEMFNDIQDGEDIFDHEGNPVGKYVLEKDGLIVATGGFMTYYNPPFADLYMEVHSEYRRQGYGSFLVQEIKKRCYLSGRVPAARTSVDNHNSRRTLERAGMRVCGFLLRGGAKVK